MNEDTSGSRRKFLKDATASAVAISAALRAAPLLAQEAAPQPAPQEEKPVGPPVVCGIIGCGVQGRVLLAQLMRMNKAKVAAVCDVYAPSLKRAKEGAAPETRTYDDYRKLLDSEKDLEAVIIATPPHLHLTMVSDVLQSGRHVFCESPLANTLDESRKLAQLDADAKKVFHIGYQRRASDLYRHAHEFIKTGVAGQITQVKAQWHSNESWRRAVVDEKTEKLLNWRLYKETSGGLMLERGSLQLDAISWYLNAKPLSVMGLSGIDRWKDGRQVADSVQALYEYPNGIKVCYTASLNSSYNRSYELFLGTDAAVLMDDELKGLMFKEPEAAMLGWEVYARKEKIGEEIGILLDAYATRYERPAHLVELQKTGKIDFYMELEHFLDTIRGQQKAHCSPADAYAAAVMALRTNEALEKGTRLPFTAEMFKV